MKPWIKNTFPYILVYLLLTIFYFWPVIIPTIIKNKGNMVIFGDDLLGALIYDRILLIKAFKDFIIPWWNPYIHNGLTFHALANGQFFYPFTLFFIIFPLIPLFTISLVFHVILAGFGMFLLTRTFKISIRTSFMSGVVFMFCGFYYSKICVGHLFQMPLSEELKINAFSNKRLRAKEVWIPYHERIGESKLFTWKDGFTNLFFYLKRG